MTPEQQTFIETELFQLTLGAVTQRGGVYEPNLSEGQRQPVHDTLRELLRDLARDYTTGSVCDDWHMANIERIARSVSERHAAVLPGGQFRIGSAQKALNLHLKYRWCLGEIPMPPHCPFDAYVLRAIPGWQTRSWTAIDSIDHYADLVAAAQTVAGERPLAEWELALYNEVATA